MSLARKYLDACAHGAVDGVENDFARGMRFVDRQRLPLDQAVAKVLEAAETNDLRGHKGRCALEAALTALKKLVEENNG